MYANSLKDCLHSLSLGENNNQHLTQYQMEYYKGLVIGCVAGVQQYNGGDWYKSIKIIIANLPYGNTDIFKQCIPYSWRETLEKTGDIK